MTTSDLRPLRQAPAATSQAMFLAASRLTQIARDQFWAARRTGDRRAMIHWSAKENALRRAHGLMAMSPLSAGARAVA